MGQANTYRRQQLHLPWGIDEAMVQDVLGNDWYVISDDRGNVVGLIMDRDVANSIVATMNAKMMTFT